MKNPILGVVIVAVVLAGVTLFFAGWFLGPTLMGSYGYGHGCWGARGHETPAAMGAAWTRGGTSRGKDMPRDGGRCGSFSQR